MFFGGGRCWSWMPGGMGRRGGWGWGGAGVRGPDGAGEPREAAGAAVGWEVGFVWVGPPAVPVSGCRGGVGDPVGPV